MVKMSDDETDRILDGLDPVHLDPVSRYRERNHLFPMSVGSFAAIGTLVSFVFILCYGAWFACYAMPGLEEKPKPGLVIVSTVDIEEVKPDPLDRDEIPVVEVHPVVEIYRVTCYGPPSWTEEGHVARWPMTIGEGLAWASELQLDGICAVGRQTPWYYRIRSEMPPILRVDGHGDYLAIDRIGHGSDIDIWTPYEPGVGGPKWAHDCSVREITETDKPAGNQRRK